MLDQITLQISASSDDINTIAMSESDASDSGTHSRSAGTRIKEEWKRESTLTSVDNSQPKLFWLRPSCSEIVTPEM